MAKDTEKLIRQLSLISYLMAERRPVTALEIRRDVEGYSAMNEDAFARRFYADRSELDSLGIALTVERPVDGVAEQENYSLRPENFHLPAIAFSDAELAALQTALSLLDGEFAYAEPLRLALQQISWGRSNPLHAPEQRSVGLGINASVDGHDLSQRLAKIETAIFRNKTITFDYYTMARDETGTRKVDPYHLLFKGEFYLLGLRPRAQGAARLPPVAHPRQGRLRDEGRARLQGPAGGLRPAPLRQPRRVAVRRRRSAPPRSEISERIAWQIERHFGRFGEVQPAGHRRRHRVLDAVRRPPPARRRGCCGSASTPACSARPSSSASSPSASSCCYERHRAPTLRARRRRRPGEGEEAERRRAVQRRRAAPRPRSGPSASRAS